MSENNPINDALKPMQLTEEEAEELERIIRDQSARPTLPLRSARRAPSRPLEEIRRIGHQRRRSPSIEDIEQ